MSQERGGPMRDRARCKFAAQLMEKQVYVRFGVIRDRSGQAAGPARSDRTLVDLVTERCKVDWLGLRPSAPFSKALRLSPRHYRHDHDNWDIRSQRLGAGQEFKTAHPRLLI